MLDRSTPTANDQIIAFDPMFVADGDISDLLEPEKGITDQLSYGNWLGISHYDFSSEEDIRERKPLGQFPITTRREASREINQPTWMTQSPTTDEGLASISRPPALELQWRQMLERFDVISRREDNWDGYESRKPNKRSLDVSKQFMDEFLDVVVSEGHSWLAPLISSDEDGHITVEWYGEERQLHLQIEEDEVVYIQAWGPNIDTEMHVDTLYRKDYLALWTWLLYG